MLWLYIIFGIVLFFALVLAIPIKIKVQHKKAMLINLYIGFVKLPLVPKKAKKQNKKNNTKPQTKTQKKNEASKKTNIIEKNGLTWLVTVIKKAAALAAGVLKDFFKHIIIKKMMLSISVAEDDAAQTAIRYGQICSAVYPAIGIIAKSTKCRTYGIDIKPNFDENAVSEYELDLEAKTRLFWIIFIVLKHGKALLDILDEFNK